MINYARSLYNILNHPTNKDVKLKTLLRIVWWKINQNFFRQPSIVELAKGIKCVCYPDSSFGGLVVYTKYPEYDEMSFVQSFLQPNDIFCDVGANIGSYSLIASSKIKSGKIFAFEPSPKAVDCLKENIRLNGLDYKIKVVAKVVSDKVGYEYFSVGKFSEVDHIYTLNDDKREKAKIASIRLDEYLSSQKINKVDLIKIDVEGAEFKVMQGLKRFLKKGKVGVLIFELNSHSVKFGNTHIETVEFLEKFDYKVYKFCGKNKIVKIKNKDLKNKETTNILAVHSSHIFRAKKFLKA